MAFLTRSFVIVIAFLIAGLAADITLAVGIIASDIDADRLERVRFFASAFLATGYGPAIGFGLPVLAIVVAEAVRIRSVFYYAIGGAVIGLVTSYSVDLSEALENTTDITPLDYPLVLGAAAGIVGGLMYWAIAGRYAGTRQQGEA